MGPDAHAASHGPAHSHGDAPGHATLQGYLTGFGLSVVLTAIPFILVMGGVFSSATVTALLVLGLGIVQIIVHVFYFLHMNSKSENGWLMLAMIFTVVLVLITLSGSLWIMYHLNENMMPPSVQDMRQAP